MIKINPSLQHLHCHAPPYHHLRSSSSLTKLIQLTATAPCSYLLLQHDFSFTYGPPPVLAAYTPPPHCPSPSSAKIVLECTATCKGRQFDRRRLAPPLPRRPLLLRPPRRRLRLLLHPRHTSHVTELSFGYVSDDTPNPPPTLTPPSPRNSSLEELIFIEIGGADGLLYGFWEGDADKILDSWSILNQEISGYDNSSHLNRSSLPPDFIFGAASSAYQVDINSSNSFC
ncbi:hypothetical protein SASPL_135002 [Salvia splendens]|uniref:Peptide N-acetyl-beta-D-glucosaminyl asparaginase amidase A N-terminal domain-containing protein n=1 Tax=Salvia splendens TaxID=180675 RepID=A0A8X8WYU1_SALSN|nr:hypothetical protein SASPL_135002 [Salvia splendens]